MSIWKGLDLKVVFIRYQIPSYTTITAQYDYLDTSNDSFVYNDAKMRFQAAIQKYNEEYAKKAYAV
ncbi:hypothetical protein GCM10020331_025320 [Ectobacillus funiculus]